MKLAVSLVVMVVLLSGIGTPLFSMLLWGVTNRRRIRGGETPLTMRDFVRQSRFQLAGIYLLFLGAAAVPAVEGWLWSVNRGHTAAVIAGPLFIALAAPATIFARLHDRQNRHPQDPKTSEGNRQQHTDR